MNYLTMDGKYSFRNEQGRSLYNIIDIVTKKLFVRMEPYKDEVLNALASEFGDMLQSAVSGVFTEFEKNAQELLEEVVIKYNGTKSQR